MYVDGQCSGLRVTLGALCAPPIIVNGALSPAKVSAAGPVYRGDFVKKVRELEMVTSVRYTAGAVTVLDAAVTGDKRVTVLYLQDGHTVAKAVKFEGGALTLGNPVRISEHELEGGRVVNAGKDRCAVIFRGEGAGQIAVISYKDRAGTIAYTDIWDAEDPYNIAAAGLEDGRLVLSYLRRSEAYGGRAFARVLTLGEAGAEAGPAAEVSGQVHGVGLTPDFDPDEYEHAWQIAALSPGVAVVNYYQAEERTGFTVLDIDAGAITPRYHGQYLYAGTLPATALVPMDGRRWMAVNGISRLGEGSAPTKAMLTYEEWGLTKYGAVPCCWGQMGQAFGTNLGLVSAGHMGPDLLAVGYAAEEKARSVLLDLSRGRPEIQPAAEAGAVERFSKLLPLNGTFALYIHQSGGEGWVRVLRTAETVASSGRDVDALAISGGNPGETISIKEQT